MKGILITVIIVLILALVGWISFSNNDSAATISIDKQEIKQDVQDAAGEIREATNEVIDAAQDAAGDAEAERDEPAEEDPAAPTTP